MNDPSEPAVHLENLCAGYGAADVLKGLSADFWRGRVFVLVGRNGAGKSTLIRVLTGALRPTAGRLRFAAGRAAVGLAPQQIALYPWLSPSENCFAFGLLSGLTRRAARERLGPVIRLTGCEPVARTPVARLSGGYQRRANIAAALMNEPELLILDEPTAGLDAEGRAHIAAVVTGLREAGAAVLLVTHDFEFAEALADEVGVLVGGAFACAGAPAELIASRLGGGERIECLMKATPDAAERARLAALGAEPTSDARRFHWPQTLDAARAAADAAGLHPAEWRARRASLADLFAAETA